MQDSGINSITRARQQSLGLSQASTPQDFGSATFASRSRPFSEFSPKKSMESSWAVPARFSDPDMDRCDDESIEYLTADIYSDADLPHPTDSFRRVLPPTTSEPNSGRVQETPTLHQPTSLPISGEIPRDFFRTLAKSIRAEREGIHSERFEDSRRPSPEATDTGSSDDGKSASGKRPKQASSSHSSPPSSDHFHFPGASFDDDLDGSLLDLDASAINTEPDSARGVARLRSGEARQMYHMSAVSDAIAADPQHTLSRNGPVTTYQRHDEHGVYSVGRRAVLRSTSSFNRHLEEGRVQRMPAMLKGHNRSLRSLHNQSVGAGIPAAVADDPSLHGTTVLLQECTVMLQALCPRNDRVARLQSDY